MKKEDYLDITFIDLSLGRRVCYSVVSSFIIAFLLMFIFNLQKDLCLARSFFVISFVGCFLLIYLFVSSRFARTSRFVKKKAHFRQIKTIKFKLNEMQRFQAYFIFIFLLLYTLFLIVFVFFRFSLFNLFLIFVFLFTTIVYFLLFFYNVFSYAVCKKGLVVRGIGLPKFYAWRQISKFRIRKKIIYLYFKNTKYYVSLPYNKGVNLKKYVK